MSEVTIKLPDSGWYPANDTDTSFIPANKELCVIIPRLGGRTPQIYQFRRADWLHKESDYFLDVSEKWRFEDYECGADWEPGFMTMNLIDCWKPLGLPQDEDRRLKEEIESWFEDTAQGLEG